MNTGLLLEDLTWEEAEKALGKNTIVVIPLGAQCKEHGFHLKLKNDWVLAEYLKLELQKQMPVVIAPTVNYGYYPAFEEYPGSVCLQFETACYLIVDICKSLAAFGPKHFYVLNTGVSTEKVLAQAAKQLEADNIVLKYTQLNDALGSIEKQICQQKGGSHADEVETSMMLYIDSSLVNMQKVVDNFSADGFGPLTRKKGNNNCYSPSGVWGSPSLASYEKGKQLIEALLKHIIDDINSFSKM